MKRLPSWFFQGAQASRLCCLVVTGGTPVPLGQARNRSPIGRAALSVTPDISCLAWNIRPEGRYGLMSSGLPGLTPLEKGKNHFSFSDFPGRPRQTPWPKELGRGAYFTR